MDVTLIDLFIWLILKIKYSRIIVVIPLSENRSPLFNSFLIDTNEIIFFIDWGDMVWCWAYGFKFFWGRPGFLVLKYPASGITKQFQHLRQWRIQNFPDKGYQH